MSENIRGTYFCLLDDVDLEDNINLDEFNIRYYNAKELLSLLKGSEECDSSEENDRFERYSKFPWACREETIHLDDINKWGGGYAKLDLWLKHTVGRVSWKPFTDLIRTLNLLKESPGPVITRQFYFTLFTNAKTKVEIGKVIYGEPAFDIIDDCNGSRIRPRLREYTLGKNDVAGFSNLRDQVSKCLSKDSDLSNSHLRIAIHYFENGDRRLKAPTLTGSFDAIDPLMSYDAALESLVIRESEYGVGKKLSRRVSTIIDSKIDEVQNFCKRVFWLRSKFAHGARTVEDIEHLIVIKPNKEIQNTARNLTIRGGNYRDLFLTSHEFPGFLANLREITRRTIRFFCDEHLKGNSREDIIAKLNQ